MQDIPTHADTLLAIKSCKNDQENTRVREVLKKFGVDQVDL
jgi:hypothetical protein